MRELTLRASHPFLEVGQLVEETLILGSGAGNDPVQDGPRVENLLLVDTVSHLAFPPTSPPLFA